jgi:hypothetical protein
MVSDIIAKEKHIFKANSARVAGFYKIQCQEKAALSGANPQLGMPARK